MEEDLRRIFDYAIATSSGLGERHRIDFECQIRAAIREGWEPLGGVVLDGLYFRQALVKYEEGVQ